MGSKKYQEKYCVYCVDGISEGADHVICREFFPPDCRRGLPKAPACKPCNSRKSELEHYLTAVLPFGSDHETALQSQVEKVKRRLWRNPALKDELRSGRRPVSLKARNGKTTITTSLPFQPDLLAEYCGFVVKGLVWHEWSTIIPKDYLVEVMPVSQHGLLFFRDLLKMSPELRQERSFANGGLRYICTRNREDAAFSVWHIKLYDDLLLAGLVQEDTLERVHICALTGPPSIRSKIERLKGEA